MATLLDRQQNATQAALVPPTELSELATATNFTPRVGAMIQPVGSRAVRLADGPSGLPAYGTVTGTLASGRVWWAPVAKVLIPVSGTQTTLPAQVWLGPLGSATFDAPSIGDGGNAVRQTVGIALYFDGPTGYFQVMVNPGLVGGAV